MAAFFEHPVLKYLPFGGLLLVVGVGLFFLARFDPAVNSQPGNPRSEALTSRELAERRLPFQQDEARRAQYAEQVVAGEMSFEQAGCEYRGGEWVSDTQSCARIDPSTGRTL